MFLTEVEVRCTGEITSIWMRASKNGAIIEVPPKQHFPSQLISVATSPVLLQIVEYILNWLWELTTSKILFSSQLIPRQLSTWVFHFTYAARWNGDLLPPIRAGSKECWIDISGKHCALQNSRSQKGRSFRKGSRNSDNILLETLEFLICEPGDGEVSVPLCAKWKWWPSESRSSIIPHCAGPACI
jgi:hypothetical protein